MSLYEDWKREIPVAEKKWAGMWEQLTNMGIDRRKLWPRAEEIPLWDVRTDQTEPAIGIFPLRRECRDFVLIIAGGAFLFKSAHEAAPVAKAFYRNGYNVAILDYRCRPYPDEAICADGMRAIRFLRHYARTEGMGETRIIAGGFSAGGILISLMNTQTGRQSKWIRDKIDHESAVPDAEFLIYGAFTDAGIPERMSDCMNRLCGFDMDEMRRRAQGSILAQLPVDVPPAFMVQTDDDDPLFILEMAKAWRDRGIPCEAHLFHGGGHGGGLYDGRDGAEDNAHAAHWFELCCEWIETHS